MYDISGGFRATVVHFIPRIDGYEKKDITVLCIVRVWSWFGAFETPLANICACLLVAVLND